MINEIKAAYLAGLIDGEGCVFLAKYGQVIQVTSTDLDIIERAYAYSGNLGHIRGPISHARTNRDGGKNKTHYEWTVSDRAGSILLLNSIYPHMSARRKNSIDEILTYIKSRTILDCQACGVSITPKPNVKYCINKECKAKRVSKYYQKYKAEERYRKLVSPGTKSQSTEK